MKFSLLALLGSTQAITLWTLDGRIAYQGDDDEEVNLQIGDWNVGAQYDRVTPGRFSGDGDDIFTRSMIQNYAVDKNCAGKDETPKACGIFFMTEATTKAAAKEVLCTHKGLCGDKLAKYLDTYWAKAWGHFDVNKSGSIAVKEPHHS